MASSHPVPDHDGTPAPVRRLPRPVERGVSRLVLPVSLEPALLPATKAVPLVLLPVAGVPTIDRLLRAADRAGLDDVTLVAGAAHRAVEDHLDGDLELERLLVDADDGEALRRVHATVPVATVHVVRGRRRLGLAAAAVAAGPHVRRDPFVLVDPRRHVPGDADVLADLVATAARTSLPVVALPAGCEPAAASPAEVEALGRFVLTAEVVEELMRPPAAGVPDGDGHRLGVVLAARLRRGTAVPMATAVGSAEVADLADPVDRLRVELDLLLADPATAARAEGVATAALSGLGSGAPADGGTRGGTDGSATVVAVAAHGRRRSLGVA